jgi:hypothetical protein
MLLALAHALAAPASAAPTCAEPFSTQDWQLALTAMERAFEAADFDRATQLVAFTEARLPCLPEVVRPGDLARFAQAAAYAALSEGDGENGERWASLALVAAPGLPPPDWIPVSHTARVVLSTTVPPAPAGPTAAAGVLTLSAPAGGGAFLDGRFLPRAEATPGVPHLRQIADRRGRVVDGAWQDGAAFPADQLREYPEAPSAPAWYQPPALASSQSSAVDTTVIGAPDAKARWGRLTLATGAAAVVTYGLAWTGRTLWSQQPTDGFRGLTNGATLASGVAAGATVGFGVTYLAVGGR